MRFRILPLIIVLAFASVTVKLFDLVVEHVNVPNDIVVSKFEALAQEAEEVVDENSQTVSEDGEAFLSPGYSGSGPKELEVTNMSDMERNLLENLVKRRKELEEWSASIAMKENILNATEKKINRKMEELSMLKEEVNNLLNKYSEKENKKIHRLVKIYENMKPQSAADIFQGMEIDILLEVVSKMKEAKAAKILAKMDPVKAEEITSRLANQRKLSTN